MSWKRILFAALFIVCNLAAREVPVRYFLEDGVERSGNFVQLARDTVHLSIPADSGKHSDLLVYKLDVRRIIRSDNDTLIDLTLTDYVVPELPVDSVAIAPPYPAGNATIRVISEPAACRLYINGRDLDVITPYTISGIKAGKYELSVRKYLKDVDWWSSEKVKLKENETLTVKLELKRPRTELSVITLPEAAEVYIDREPSLSRMPDYETDVTISGIRPTVSTTLHLRKIGYQDTSVTTEVRAFMPNMIYVEMEPIRDNLALLEMQNEFNAERRSRWIGRGLLWSSIAPIVAGGVLWYLAEQDWKKAAEAKDKYNAAAFETDKTAGYLSDNRKYNDAGDTKIAIGASLGAVGLALAITGVVLQF